MCVCMYNCMYASAYTYHVCMVYVCLPACVYACVCICMQVHRHPKCTTRPHMHLLVFSRLQPENLLLTSDGHMKLVDFGSAKLLRPLEGVTGGADLDGNHQSNHSQYISYTRPDSHQSGLDSHSGLYPIRTSV